MATFAAPRLRGPRAVGWGLCLTILGACACQTAVSEEASAPPADRAPPPAGPLTLQGCIELGLSRQPALAAARASLAAAESGYQAVENIRFGRFLTPDYRYRRDQSCLGVVIASAGLTQSEWETRYAVRRTFYSVMYANMQKEVIDSAVNKIEDAHKKAKQLVEAGDPKIKVTQIDVDILAVNKEFVKTKQQEATVGIDKAMAGLREALGVGVDYPLKLVDEPLPALVKDINRNEMISLALANRAELQQAQAMNSVTSLEIDAQRSLLFKPQSRTFASGGDIHAKPIPQGVANGEYRPGAIGPEMPPFLFGKRADRVQRASDFNDRAVAVVDKTENLITLEVEATRLKWYEAAQNVQNLGPTREMAKKIADNVKKRFNDGNESGESYLRASTLEDQARGLYNQALFEHALGLAALERVTAGGYRVPAGK
jgi:outer membrane protein TolC